MIKAGFVWVLFAATLAYFNRPEFVFVAVAGLAIGMAIGIPRAAALPKITEADVADAWLRVEGWLIRTRRAVLAKIDPERAFRRSRREHEEGALRVEKEAQAHHGPH